LDTTQRIYNKYDDLESTGILFEGTSNADIEFPAEVKEALDKTRAKIKPTIEQHHFYKSAGYTSLVDFAEMIIEERPEERKYITTKLDKIVSRDIPRVDDPVNIEHVKLDGRNIVLARGRVIESTANRFVIRRQFRHTNRKLKLVKEYSDDIDGDEGDYAVTYVVPRALTLFTKYYSRTGDLKGTYANINTGVEIYPSNGTSPGKIRYVDLEIDVVQAPVNEAPRIIDQHLLKRAVQRGFITEEMAEQSRKRAETVSQQMAKGIDMIGE